MIVLPVAGVLSVAGLLVTLVYVNFPKSNWTVHDQERWISNSTENIRCQAPELDPFSEEVTIYERIPPKIRCLGQDWVKCYHSKCRVVDAIKYIVTDIKCTFSDILYEDGYNYTTGPPMQLVGDDIYELKESDHVKVACVGTWIKGYWFTPKNTSWSGNAFGLRAVRPPPPPAPLGREQTPSVVIFVFHSAGRHAFIRHMPKSWQMLKEIGATVMEGYNVVGATTRDALMPILSGQVWKNPRESAKFDPDSLIFSKLKQDGYRTAYFEDRPDIGMFHHYFNTFARQPTNHYPCERLMTDLFDTEPAGYRKYKKQSYCVGDTPQAKFMMNMTHQFLELGGKGFIFTFISGIAHDDFDQITNADDDTAAFLDGLFYRTEDTLIVVMGDHGPRLREARKHSRQSKLEHLLPLLAIRLPDQVTRARPHAQRALEANARALTTPHDLHATILDVLDMRQHSNPHKIEDAAYPRALTMLELIPRNRSCSEAGIVPDYCACIIWQNASADEFHKPARALVDYINLLLIAFGNSTEILKQFVEIQCKAPKLDPFSKDITQYDEILPDIRCLGQDWVKCYHSKCRVVDAIKDIITDIKCTFSDIIYNDDFNYTIGPPIQLVGDDFYKLEESDHVKVACVGTWIEGYWFRPKNTSWSGNVLGLRAVRPPPAPPGRERTPSVVIFGFDSAARHAFIRHMPKSWQMLKKIGTTVMEGYNVVGEATRDALMPILSGRVWKMPGNYIFDPDDLIFSKAKQDGYRTAYFEDRPDIGTFQYYYEGFARQPTDHYLRAFLMADWFDTEPAGYLKYKKKSYCLGDTPQFKVMINMTQQFLELDGKGFIFTFISDICHDSIEIIRNADDDMAAFLHGLLSRTEDTLIVVMADHGPRYSEGRKHSRQGKFEHLLPLMAIRLPDRLTRARPYAQRALEANALALTTPRDLHATILDVLDMRQHSIQYKIKGAAYPRALTMLELIPRNRTCFDAGIEPHYCACITWQNVSADDPIFHKPAHALVDYINSLLIEAGDLCVPRTVTSTLWVLRQADSPQTAHSGALDANENYEVKIVTDPAGAMFEATMSYSAKEDKFTTDREFINRVNRYWYESECVRLTHSRLNVYCYCRDQQD